MYERETTRKAIIENRDAPLYQDKKQDSTKKRLPKNLVTTQIAHIHHGDPE
jgi:hypothetical protein